MLDLQSGNNIQQQPSMDTQNSNNTVVQPTMRQQFNDSIVGSAVSKCEQNIEAAELLLQTEDTTSALRHIQASKKIIREMKSSKHGDKKKELTIKCRGAHARILEADNKYLAAAWNYYMITIFDDIKTEDPVTNKELKKGMDNSIKCCILAKACTARDELMQKLYDDPRSINSISCTMLRNMHQKRIISPQDMEDFGKLLPMQDQIKLIGEYTILQKAVYEHNMRAISRIYKNINIKDLSFLLGISMEAAEDLARVMIYENRLHGTIDQVDNEITFNQHEDVRFWDIQIKQLLSVLNECVDMINDQSSMTERP